MAEGLARATAPAGWRMYSAGSRPGALNPSAVVAMREIGIDISDHHAKGLDAVPIGDADYVVTLCAEEECPVAFTKGRRLAWPHADPASTGDLDGFRAVRDAIAQRIQAFWKDVATEIAP
jgi:protein-tyrosine-phosphatase